ncbi:MAG: hypothetical protein QOG29_1133, partial [Gaiellaceae bacterium]|nr:hypothetical protein [Gaiellaceae bacterium]
RSMTGTDVRYLRIRGRYAYAAGDASGAVVDLLNGRETPGVDTNLLYGLLLP